MPEFNLIERALLESANADPAGTIYPFSPAFLTGQAIMGAIANLVARGFAADREVDDILLAYRSEGDRHYGIFATEAGVAAGAEKEPLFNGQADEAE